MIVNVIGGIGCGLSAIMLLASFKPNTDGYDTLCAASGFLIVAAICFK